MGKLEHFIKYLIECVLELIYPKIYKCIVCKKKLNEEKYICDECKRDIKYTEKPYYIYDVEAYAIAYYSYAMKKLILDFKYKNNFIISEYFGDELYEIIIKNKIKADYITYVPSSKGSLKSRGFNQCYVIAKELSKLSEIPILDTLIRIKENKEQKYLSKEDRIKNIKGVFEIKGEVITSKILENKTIILIDDVVTTGATIGACIEELKKIKNLKIIVLTLSKSYI